MANEKIIEDLVDHASAIAEAVAAADGWRSTTMIRVDVRLRYDDVSADLVEEIRVTSPELGTIFELEMPAEMLDAERLAGILARALRREFGADVPGGRSPYLQKRRA